MNTSSYDPEADVMTIRFAEGRIDDAIESGGVISHFDEGGRLLFIEILNASQMAQAILSSHAHTLPEGQPPLDGLRRQGRDRRLALLPPVGAYCNTPVHGFC